MSLLSIPKYNWNFTYFLLLLYYLTANNNTTIKYCNLIGQILATRLRFLDCLFSIACSFIVSPHSCPLSHYFALWLMFTWVSGISIHYADSDVTTVHNIYWTSVVFHWYCLSFLIQQWWSNVEADWCILLFLCCMKQFSNCQLSSLFFWEAWQYKCEQNKNH